MLKQPLKFSIFFLLYLSHNNKDISGRCIVMSLQQIDLCEQLLGTAARGGHVFSACTTAKQVGLFLFETVVV